jgi:hypothetical protein
MKRKLWPLEAVSFPPGGIAGRKNAQGADQIPSQAT